MKTETPPPPSFKELLAAATPSKWKSSGGIVRIDSPDKYKQERICTIPSPSGAAPEAWEEIGNRRAQLAAYIARLNPATMGLVLEALEHLHNRTQTYLVGRDPAYEEYQELHRDFEMAEAALSALNSPAP